MAKSIYPSIPMPGADLSTVLPAIEAMRQTINLIILNGLFPNPNYTPSETAQVFVTYAALTKTGVVGPPGPQGPQGPPGASGVPEAPNDANTYGRHALTWQIIPPIIPEAPNDANTYGRHALGWQVIPPPGISDAPNDANIYGRHALGWQNISVGANMVSVAAPVGTSSTTFVMQGLDLSVTATIATKLLLSVSGDVANSLNNGETDMQLFYGTGTPPVNGAALTGTALGSMLRYEASTGGSVGPFAKTVVVTGLTLGTTYWFDVGLKVVTGNGSIANVDLAGHGIV